MELRFSNPFDLLHYVGIAQKSTFQSTKIKNRGVRTPTEAPVVNEQTFLPHHRIHTGIDMFATFGIVVFEMFACACPHTLFIAIDSVLEPNITTTGHTDTERVNALHGVVTTRYHLTPISFFLPFVDPIFSYPFGKNMILDTVVVNDAFTESFGLCRN